MVFSRVDQREKSEGHSHHIRDRSQTTLPRFGFLTYPQIREPISGPDLHVFTLKFLALKKLVFPP